jgi:hypothetical protein
MRKVCVIIEDDTFTLPYELSDDFFKIAIVFGLTTWQTRKADTAPINA